MLRIADRTLKTLGAAVVVGALVLSLLTSSSGAATTVSTFVGSSSPTLANFPNQSVVDSLGRLWVVSNDNPGWFLTRVDASGTAEIVWSYSATALPSPSDCTDQRNYGIASHGGRIYWTCMNSAVYSISENVVAPATTADITLEVAGAGRAFSGVAVAPNGDIYVSEWGNHLYKHPAGSSVGTVTTVATPPAATDMWAMTFGPDGNLYVANEDRIYVVDVAGGTDSVSLYFTAPSTSWSIAGLAFVPGTTDLVTSDTGWAGPPPVGVNVIAKSGSVGVLDRELVPGSNPLVQGSSGLAIAADGTIYVTITNAGSIHAITKIAGAVTPGTSSTTTSSPSTTNSGSDPVAPAFAG